jgi:hypothetical protein
MRALRLAPAAVVCVVAACAAVPDIRFMTDASATPDGSSQTDAGDGGGGDAGPCPGPQPAGGVCCGTIWCVGMSGPCDPGKCAECEAMPCAGGDICCGKVGMVQCKSSCP